MGAARLSTRTAAGLERLCRPKLAEVDTIRRLARLVVPGQKAGVLASLRPVRRHAIALALILSLTALLEWLSGRPFICTCGSVKLWTGVVNGPENSQMVADWYSLSHVLHGLLLFWVLWLAARRRSTAWRLVVAVLIEAGWELLENSPIVVERYRSATVALGYSGDSILNSMGDVVFMMLGFGLARLLPGRASIVLGVGLELVSLAAIRDNLALNVLMLVYPVDAIRVWQGG